MRLFDAMRSIKGDAVHKISKRIALHRSIAPECNPLFDHLYKRRFEITIAATLSGSDADEERLRELATRILAREIFGEIQNDLFNVFEMASEEGASIELCEEIEKIINKCSGE